MANTWFNEDVYLQNKLTAWQAEAGNADKDLEALKKAIADEGMTPESHFLQFGADEGLSPNEFFVIDEYVANQVVFLNDRDGVTTWTAKSFKDAVKAAGMTLWSHYQQYGWAEANPSNSFDAEQYFADKLTALQEDPATKAEWADKTVTDVKDAFEKAGIDPVSHYFAYGKDEGVAVTPVDTQPNTLTEALAALQDAQDKVAAFLKDSLNNEAVKTSLALTAVDPEEPTPAEIRDAIDDVVTAAQDAITAHQADLTGSDYETAAAGAFDGDTLNVLAAKLLDAQDVLAEKNAEVAAKTGLAAAVATLNTAQTQAKEAIADKSAKQTTATAEASKAAVLNDLNPATDVTASFTAASEGDVVVALDGSDIIVLGKKGVLEAKSGLDTSTVKGFADLLAAYQAAYTAATAQVKADEALQKAIIGVLNIEKAAWDDVEIDGSENITFTDVAGGSTTDFELFTIGSKVYAGKPAGASLAAGDVLHEVTSYNVTDIDTTNEVEVKLNSLKKLDVTSANLTSISPVGASNKLVDKDTSALQVGDYYTNTSGEFQAKFGTDAPLSADAADAADTVKMIEAIIAEREELIADSEDLDTFAESLEALDKELAAAQEVLEDLGYSVISIDAATVTGNTGEADIFLLGTTESDIVDFEVGSDQIFLGQQFKLVVAEEDQTINDRLGDASVLEVFLFDDGTNTTLYFEQTAFAGSGSTDADTVKIELTGITGAEIAITAEGFLTIA